MPIGAMERLALAALLAGCQGIQVVDGWPLGREIPCEMTMTEPDARAALERELHTRFGATQVIEERCSFPGPYTTADGGQVYWEATPGGVELHALAFADGNRHVIALSCPGRMSPRPGEPPVVGPRCGVTARP